MNGREYRFAASIALGFCLVFAEAAEGQIQTAPTRVHQVAVKKGEILQLAIDTPLDSGKAKEGEAVTFHLQRPLVSAGETVLPAGFVVQGRLTKVEPAGLNCRPGSIEWRFEDAVAPDGARFRLRRAGAVLPRDGGKLVEIDKPMTVGQKIQMGLIIVALSPLFALGLALALPWVATDAIRGEGATSCQRPGAEQVITSGSVYYAALRRDVRVTLPDNPDEAPAAAEPKPESEAEPVTQ